LDNKEALLKQKYKFMPRTKEPEPHPKSCKTQPNFICKITKKLFSFFSSGKKTEEPFYKVLTELKTSAQKMSIEEKNILTNFLKFSHKKVGDVMVPRSDISAISVKSSIDDLSRAIIKRAHTRTIIYHDTLDHIVGFVHIKDLFNVMANEDKTTLKKIMRQPLSTTSATKLIDLLVEMRRKRTHMAIVVDEYGGTEGIVTIEDIVEEIIGEIEDEHDDTNGANHDYTVISDGVIVTHARVEIDEIEEAIGVSLKSDDEEVDTIGGLIMMRFGHVPKPGEVINLAPNIIAEVLDSNSRVIKRLKITYNLSNE
jgi:CBS domain containing-hemolysin-like protein